jgi:hypothetical protein
MTKLRLSLSDFSVRRVTPEGPGDRELAQLVTNHVLADQNRDVLAPVVYGYSEPHHFRQDHGTPRPGLDRALDILLDRLTDLLRQVMIDKRAFFD